MGPAAAVFLQSFGLGALGWERLPVEGAKHEEGFGFSLSLGTTWMSEDGVLPSFATVTEDDRALPLPHTPPSAVAEKGRGRYGLRDGTLWFSSTDGSDALTNGRRYEVLWPRKPPGLLRTASYVLAVLATLAVVLRYPAVRAWRPSFTFSALVFVLPVLFHRAWFFLDFPLPALHPDSTSYYALVDLVKRGVWPDFGIRPPLYPLFLLVFGTPFRVVAAQSLVMLAAGLLLVRTVHRVRAGLAPGAALAMAGFACGIWPLEHDTAVLSESLYVSSLVLAFGSLLGGLWERNSFYLALASASMAGAILTRPAGLFLVVTYLLVLAFLIWNRYGRARALSFGVPFSALLLALCTYNYAKLGVFALTVWGEANLTVATFTFWETDDSLPAPVNHSIRQIQEEIRGRMSAAEREAIESSWDLETLAGAFLKGFWQPSLNRAFRLGGGDFTGSRRLMRRAALVAIRRHPDRYAKFVSSMLYLYYAKNIRYEIDFRYFLQDRAKSLYVDRPYADGIGRAYADVGPPPAVTIVREADDAAVGLQSTPARRLYLVFVWLHKVVFARAVWSVLFFAVFLSSTLMLVKTRGRHAGAFFVFALTASAFGASLVVCLVEYASFRYSYPTEWTYYLSTALFPLAFTQSAPSIEVR